MKSKAMRIKEAEETIAAKAKLWSWCHPECAEAWRADKYKRNGPNPCEVVAGEFAALRAEEPGGDPEASDV